MADEVSNLASKSAEAAKETTVMIENSIAAVENGKKLADGAAESMSTVVEGAVSVIDALDKITSSAKDQANSITQVTQGVGIPGAKPTSFQRKNLGSGLLSHPSCDLTIRLGASMGTR